MSAVSVPLIFAVLPLKTPPLNNGEIIVAVPLMVFEVKVFPTFTLVIFAVVAVRTPTVPTPACRLLVVTRPVTLVSP